MERVGLDLDVPGFEAADPEDVAREGLERLAHGPVHAGGRGRPAGPGPTWSSARTGLMQKLWEGRSDMDDERLALLEVEQLERVMGSCVVARSRRERWRRGGVWSLTAATTWRLEMTQQRRLAGDARVRRAYRPARRRCLRVSGT